MVDLCDILTEIEANGDTSEALAFEQLIAEIEDEDPDADALMAQMPSIVMLLRIAHKRGFWHGAEFGRATFLNLEKLKEE